MDRTEQAATWEDPGSLVPWDRNPRDNDHAVDRVARSIQRFGFGSPIVARVSDRRIVAGHTRWKAAARLSLSEVPVRWLDLDDHEAAALALADNRLSELADWIDVDVAKVLHDLKADDVAIDDLGWTPGEVDALLDSLTEVDGHTRGPVDDDTDEAPEARPMPGNVQLHVGDALHVLRKMPDASLDALVTDPPYGMSDPPDVAEVLTQWLANEDYDHGRPGFMGKDWDSFVPGPAIWREVFRCLKPGAHGVVFASTRTVDLMGIALRLAGFEVKDTIEWVYWSGMPANMSIDKAIDKMRHDRDQILTVTAWIRGQRDARELSNSDLDEPFGFAGMAGHWTSGASQPSVPTLEQWPKLLEILEVDPADVPPEIQHLAVELNSRKGQPAPTWFGRKVVGEVEVPARAKLSGTPHGGDSSRATIPNTEPATDAAREWQGFGTRLKPCHEPALLIRKPLREATIARQVLATRTGSINIDASRFQPGDRMWPGPQDGVEVLDSRSGSNAGETTSMFGLGNESGRAWKSHPLGRFPGNVLHCPKASRAEREAGCGHLPAKAGWEAVGRKQGSIGVDNPRAGAGRTGRKLHNWHPTVKPLRLMAYLVRLVTPPNGTVLDPFVGSGTTTAAAGALGGFHAIGIDLEQEHVDIATARTGYWSEHGLAHFQGFDDPDEDAAALPPEL